MAAGCPAAHRLLSGLGSPQPMPGARSREGVSHKELATQWVCLKDMALGREQSSPMRGWTPGPCGNGPASAPGGHFPWSSVSPEPGFHPDGDGAPPLPLSWASPALLLLWACWEEEAGPRPQGTPEGPSPSYPKPRVRGQLVLLGTSAPTAGP